jgi:hypothetical protein
MVVAFFKNPLRNCILTQKSECQKFHIEQQNSLQIGKDNKINPPFQQANSLLNRNKVF